MRLTLLTTLLFSCILTFNCSADRIYIMNASGYNAAGAELITAITNNGHTVTNNTTTLGSLPVGFTTTCVDPIDGYDWLCFFGNTDFTSLQPDIQAFIDLGGKVFYQYEVSCCIASATSAASVVSGLTGLAITPNPESYIAIGNASDPAWESVGCCVTITGNAYRCFDGLPINNQLLATGGLGLPSYTTCPNFGFMFSSAEFSSGQNRGGIIGFGDINIWYDGNEPFSNGGITPVNLDVVDYIFPNVSSDCFIFPPGCSDLAIVGVIGGGTTSLGSDISICPGDTVLLDAGSANTSFIWQDNSTDQTFEVTSSGTYWVETTGACGTSSDTIEVTTIDLPSVNLGPNLQFCEDSTLLLSANIINADSFFWLDNSTDSTLLISQEGTYWIQVENVCATVIYSIEVVSYSAPIVDLGPDLLICEGETQILNPSVSNALYEWQNGSSNSNLTINAAGEYWVAVTVDNCVGIDTINVLSELCLVELEMPNVFTPNSDFSNEFFIPIEMEGITSASIIIVNRWGNLVYEKDELLTGWNGKVNGVQSTEGTYFWKVNYTDIFGQSKEKHGFVTLLR